MIASFSTIIFYSDIDQVKKACVPILFAQGGKDTMVSPYNNKGAKACTATKRLLEVPEAGHSESIPFAPEEYH